MEAQTLNCPNCGAAINSESSQCRYCESKLATVACAACFGLMFLGSKHCPHCGAAAGMPTAAQLSVLKCPRCKIDMSAITLGVTALRECEKCEGLWVEVAAFERICADREQDAAVLGVATPVASPKTVFGNELPKAVYVPCPQCGQLMNRLNFAHCSGVIVDVCRGHGTWFDRDELREIIEFIRAGGLERARQKEKREIEYEREQLTQQRLNAHRQNVVVDLYSEDERAGGLSAARDLLKFLIE
jgi:Zn-finger nucleic acid-binding protein